MISVFHYDQETGFLTWKPRPGMNARNGRVAGKRAGTVYTTKDGKQYILLNVDGLGYLAHRVIWTMKKGPIPEGIQINHQDGNGLNNRFENFRLATSLDNRKNTRRAANNSSGFMGVRRANTVSERYQAFVHSNGKFIQLGMTNTAQEAHDLREKYELNNGYHPNNGQDRPL